MITEVYIQGKRLDLFDDESINVTQSVQDVNDISKVFGDYSQTFTVPATANNNEIFKFYYNADVDNGFDARLRTDGSISVNTLDFKYGKIRLDGAEIKNNQPTSYKITFFGAIVNVKDLIGEDELKDLDWLSNFDHDYSGDQVKLGLTQGLDFTVGGVTYDAAIVYPLISYKRQYLYDSDPSDHVSTDTLVNISFHNGHQDGVDSRNLKPSIKLFLIIKAIEEQYGFTFNSAFFDLLYYKSIYMNLNNSIDSLASGLNVYENLSGSYSTGQNIAYRYTTVVTPKAGFTDVDYQINLYINETLVAGQVNIGNVLNDFNNGTTTKVGTTDFTEDYTVKAEVISLVDFEFDATTKLEVFSYPSDIGWTTIFNNSYTNEVIDLRGKILDLVPDIKVYDFLTSMFKSFNLIAVAEGNDIRVEDLPSWYSSGEIYDITQFTDFEKETVNRAKIYREINWKFEDSEQILAEQFRLSNNLTYGNLEFKLTDENGDDLTSVDGGVLNIESIFENPIHERLLDIDDNNAPTTIQYTPYFNREIKPIANEPFLHYAIQTSVSSNLIGFLNDGVYESLGTLCIMPSHSYILDQNSFNLNFNSEVNEYTGEVMPNTIYQSFFDDYITDIFSVKRRMYKFKAILPDYLLANLRLNDRLIIKDRRFIINKISSNLVKREDTLELINDIYDAPLVTDRLNTSMFREPIGIFTLSAESYDANYIGVSGSSISLVDTGDGTSWITLDTPKTTSSVSLIQFTLALNSSGLDRTVGIQVNDNINNPIFTVFQNL